MLCSFLSFHVVSVLFSCQFAGFIARIYYDVGVCTGSGLLVLIISCRILFLFTSKSCIHWFIAEYEQGLMDYWLYCSHLVLMVTALTDSLTALHCTVSTMTCITFGAVSYKIYLPWDVSKIDGSLQNIERITGQRITVPGSPWPSLLHLILLVSNAWKVYRWCQQLHWLVYLK